MHPCTGSRSTMICGPIGISFVLAVNADYRWHRFVNCHLHLFLASSLNFFGKVFVNTLIAPPCSDISSHIFHLLLRQLVLVYHPCVEKNQKVTRCVTSLKCSLHLEKSGKTWCFRWGLVKYLTDQGINCGICKMKAQSWRRLPPVYQFCWYCILYNV